MEAALAFRKRDQVPVSPFGALRIRAYWPESGHATSVALVEIDQGAAHQEALSHRSDKYYFVVARGVEFTVDGETSMLDPGDAVYIPKETPFSYRNTGTLITKLLLVHVPSFDLEEEEFLS